MLEKMDIWRKSHIGFYAETKKYEMKDRYFMENFPIYD